MVTVTTPQFIRINQRGLVRYININQVVDVLVVDDNEVRVYFTRGNELLLTKSEAEPLLGYISWLQNH